MPVKIRVLLALLLTTQFAPAQTLSGTALVKALRQGGYVIVMRHASSPREAPTEKTANPDNLRLERQLDGTGRSTSIAMGKALRDLKIPIGDVLTSPTYRALETARLAGLPNPRPYPELGDGGQSMQKATDRQSTWLRAKTAEFPAHTNTIVITHLPNIAAAFPQWSSGLEDGEALVLGPDGHGGATLVARVKIAAWPQMGQ